MWEFCYNSLITGKHHEIWSLGVNKEEMRSGYRLGLFALCFHSINALTVVVGWHGGYLVHE